MDEVSSHCEALEVVRAEFYELSGPASRELILKLMAASNSGLL